MVSSLASFMNLMCCWTWSCLEGFCPVEILLQRSFDRRLRTFRVNISSRLHLTNKNNRRPTCANNRFASGVSGLIPIWIRGAQFQCVLLGKQNFSTSPLLSNRIASSGFSHISEQPFEKLLQSMEQANPCRHHRWSRRLVARVTQVCVFWFPLSTFFLFLKGTLFLEELMVWMCERFLLKGKNIFGVKLPFSSKIKDYTITVL